MIKRTAVLRYVLVPVMLLGMATFLHAAETYLNELDLSNVLTGWEQPGMNRSVSGTGLQIRDRTYARGVGVHAESLMRVKLSGSGRRFTAEVGIDEVMAGKGSVEFVVVGDGEVLWRSGRITGRDTARPVDVELTGINILDCRVHDGGDGIGQDHANWANARIEHEGDPIALLPVAVLPVLPRPVSPCNRSEARASLIPYPQEVRWLNGKIPLSTYTLLAPRDDAPELTVVVEEIHRVLSELGARRVDARDAGVRIHLELGSVASGRRTDEAYALTAKEGALSMRAPAEAGLWHAAQTLRQLIQPTPTGPVVPTCTVVDWPAFDHRGFMHDVGRNFQDPELLKRFLEVMGQYKLNLFHFHLTDHPGYRIESRKHPELNRPENYQATRRPGDFYSFEDIRELQAYARRHSIELLPEIDMPGHSQYFNRTFGFGMQSAQGVKVVRDLVTEFLDEVKTDWFHMGSDEVKLQNPAFMGEMANLIRSRDRRLVVWRPGHLPQGPVVTQLWSGRPRPLSGTPYLDSQANYINHMDALQGPVRAFMQQPCRVPEGSDTALGGVLCHWPDNNVGDTMNIYRQSPVMPALLAYAERIWRGAQHNREDAWAKLPSPEDPAYGEYQAFEKDLVAHRDRWFADWPFPYVRHTHIPWKLIGPFDHGGDGSRVFPVETAIRDAYEVDGTTWTWQTEGIRGGTVWVNHFFGFPGHLPRNGEGTVYGLTHIHADRDREVGFWLGFQEPSRSGGRNGGPNPPMGQWSVYHSKVWVNGTPVQAPVWEQPGLAMGTAEVPFVDELYMVRKPTMVPLRKGWNQVLVKAPYRKIGRKWMFTCVPVDGEGGHVREVEGLRFSLEDPR